MKTKQEKMLTPLGRATEQTKGDAFGAFREWGATRWGVIP